MVNGLQKRSKNFAIKIVYFVKQLPNKQIYWSIGNQLLRSGTSVGANTRAAYRGRSKKEFLSKLNIAIEEADESCFWLELIEETKLCPDQITEDIRLLKVEANALTAILVSVRKKAEHKT